ncbi:MAG TPA: Crp/Fnr family transcriptional regulator [Ohtaekwangia sp.]|nr:Crp/Fnr family transcriptional regulator [Ohtaekwangia sp.]
MSPEFTQLAAVVNDIHKLPEEDWEAFAAIWSPFSAKRKEVLTQAGEKERFIYFVLEGVQHVYYMDDQNREATIVFMYPPSFGGVLDAMLLQQPSRYYYETLTPSNFLRASATDLLQLMETRLAVSVMTQKGITHTLSGVLERMVELQSFSAEERFRKLLQRSPHILHLVPHKYLANYIGIDPTNFSKLINKVKI